MHLAKTAEGRSESNSLPNPAHLSSLDGLRALSILAVLACHMLPLGPHAWLLNQAVGYMGMSIFFALSGFLITRLLWDCDKIGHFFLRRMARIAPLVFLVSLLYGLLLEGRFDTFAATNLYVLNYWHGAIAPSVSPLWSLGVEMQFYIAIGLSILFFGRQGFWIVPIAAIAVTSLRFATGTFGSIMTHLRVDEILSGSLLAFIWLHRHEQRVRFIWKKLPIAFWPIVFLWLLSCWPPTEQWGIARPYLTALMIGSILAMEDGWQQKVLSSPIFRYIATISFALYVWHSPFRHGWFNQGSTFERYIVKRPIGFAMTFFLAHMSTMYFEKPIIRMAKLMENRGRRESMTNYRYDKTT